MNEFYTYAYLRKDRTPYYIGKGKGRRAYKKSKREISPPKDRSRVLFLKRNLTEEEAFKHEIYMISVFGRKDLGTGILRNLTNGGDGTSGIVYGEDRRKQISKRFKGISQDPEFIERRANSVRNHYNSEEGKKTKDKLREKRKEYFFSEKGKLQLRKSSKRWSGKNNPGYGGRFSGEKNGMYGKKLTEEHKKLLSERMKGYFAKTYTLYNPEGEEIIVHNMTKFCKDNNLPQTVMASVATGKRKHHKGWTIDKNFKYMKKSYIVTDPIGKEYSIQNLTEFCKQYDLSYSSMTNILYGSMSSHKGGWKVRKNDQF